MKSAGKPKFFYGWVIAVCCTLSVCGASLLSTGLSTNLNAMRQCLGFTNTQTSLVLTVRSISAFIVALFAERYYGRLGIRKGMALAMAFGILSFGLFALAGSNILIVYAGAVTAGVCYSYGMMMPSSMLIKNWFNRSRGTALSIASCGTALVSIIFAPIVQRFVDSFGIKSAFLMQAGALFVIMLILFFFVVEKPEEKGLEPCGGKDFVPQAKKKTAPAGSGRLSAGWFAALVGATVLIGASASPCSANYTNNLVTAGYEPMAVAKALSVYGFIIIGAKLFFGRCIDTIGAKRSTIIFGSLCTLAMVLLALANRFTTVPFLYFTLVITGLGVIVQTLGYPNWVADLESSRYDVSLERCQMGYQLGALIGSPLPGILADATGSYGPAYMLFAVFTVIAIVIVLLAYASAKKSA